VSILERIPTSDKKRDLPLKVMAVENCLPKCRKDRF
jgi:hypothetical protein